MKKIFVFLLILFAFIIGINASNYSINQNQLLQEDLENFEKEISKPNNYHKENSMIKPNQASKIANQIDDLIEDLCLKIKEVIKKL